MTRTQIYLTDSQQKQLKAQSARSGRPRSELIREALDEYLERRGRRRRREVLERTVGLWADRTDLDAIYSSRVTMDRSFPS